MSRAEYVERLLDQYETVTDRFRREGHEHASVYPLVSETISFWKEMDELVALLPTDDGAVRLGRRAHLAHFVLREQPHIAGKVDMHWVHPFLVAHQKGSRTELGVGAELWRADARQVLDTRQGSGLTIEPLNRMKLGSLALTTTFTDGNPSVLLRTAFRDDDIMTGETSVSGAIPLAEDQTPIDQATVVLEAVAATTERFLARAAA